MSDDLKIQKAVKNYLLKNPGFFSQYPELVTAINVEHDNGELTDLATHQLRALKKENSGLKKQMSALIQNAQQSESMMNRMFSLLMALKLEGGDDFLQQFIAFVTEHFKSDYFKILLDDTLPEFEVSEYLGVYTASHKKHFVEFESHSEPLSGRLQKSKVSCLFPQAGDIESVVVLPVGKNAEYGLMAFASNDQEKFHPNSATDLLQKLADILATYIKQNQDLT